MFRELKKLERDLRIMKNRARYLTEDLEEISEEIQKIINEEKLDVLGYAVTDCESVMAVGEWPYKDEFYEVEIKLKQGVTEYTKVFPDDIYIGEDDVIIKNVKIGKMYFEDAVRALCALAHERYTKKSYKSWFFSYYIADKCKEAPVFIVYNYTWFVAIAPIVEEIEDDP